MRREEGELDVFTGGSKVARRAGRSESGVERERVWGVRRARSELCRESVCVVKWSVLKLNI